MMDKRRYRARSEFLAQMHIHFGLSKIESHMLPKPIPPSVNGDDPTAHLDDSSI
jgi:hypothetical protein